jgi:hypothetical protein
MCGWRLRGYVLRGQNDCIFYALEWGTVLFQFHWVKRIVLRLRLLPCSYPVNCSDNYPDKSCDTIIFELGTKAELADGLIQVGICRRFVAEFFIAS